jgi:hypothetical protein
VNVLFHETYGQFVHDDQVGHWVCERTGEQWFAGKGQALGFLNAKGEIACGVTFYESNGRTVWMGMATDGGWATPEVFHAIAHYAYQQLGCEWVRCKIAKTNVNSTRLVESVGFELETLLTNSHPSGDEVIYRLGRDKCKWLDLEKTRDEWHKPKSN